MAEGSPVESLKFFIKDGNLHVEAEGHGSAVLNLIDEDTFEEPNYKAVFKFIRKEGVVTGFKQEVRGIEMEGIKEKP